jgi:hypothetical protein
MTDFLKPSEQQGKVRAVVGCPVHGPDKNKVIGYVSAQHNFNTVSVANDEDTVIAVVPIMEVPKTACTCGIRRI